LAKTDDVLLELRRTFAAYVKSFFPFEYAGKSYLFVNNYVAAPWSRCDVCGNHPIKYVSVIRSSDGQELRVGNKCIDRLTNRKVSNWFRKFTLKRENVGSNRRYIDGLDSILTACRKSELAFQIPENDMAMLQKAFRRMCNGLNLTGKQEQLANCYMSMSERALSGTHKYNSKLV
jgi:hypothetical protein